MKIQFLCDFYIEYLNYAYHNVKMLRYKKFFSIANTQLYDYCSIVICLINKYDCRFKSYILVLLSRA